VGPRAGLDRCGESRPHRHSIPGPSSPYGVAIPTELSGPYLVQGTVKIGTTKQIMKSILAGVEVLALEVGLNGVNLVLL
jgi:hypothetical protein